MSRKNQKSYFESRPDIVKIFKDLESYLNFCRIELFPYNEADLYQKSSWVWRKYEASKDPKKQKQRQR